MFMDAIVFDENVFIRIENKEQFEAYKKYMLEHDVGMEGREPYHDYSHVDLTYSGDSWHWYYDYPRGFTEYKFYKYRDVLTGKSEPKKSIKYDGEEELLKMCKKKSLNIHTKTIEEYNCLLIMAHRCGYFWASDKPLVDDHGVVDTRAYDEYGSTTCIFFITDKWTNDYGVTYGSLNIIDTKGKYRDSRITFEELYRMLV